MDGACQLLGQHTHHQPLARHAAEPGEGRALDRQVEVAFDAGVGVAGVARRIVTKIH